MRAPPPPWKTIGWMRYLAWRFVAILLPVLSWPFWRVRTRGTETLPRRGPYVLLVNHVSAADPVWIALRIGRPAHFMASSQLFRIPLLGGLVRFFGAFPKDKFVKDRQSLRTVQRLYEQGEVVVIFAEGRRSWDGRLTPMGNGIGRLVRRLNARVVTARIESGHLHRPRWAVGARYVAIDLSYDSPRTWLPDATPEEIAKDIVIALTIDPSPALRGRARGKNLAHGLPTYLWACPRCGAMDALATLPGDGDRVACRSCAACWRVDLNNRMHGQGNTPDFTVPSAFDALAAHMGDPPVADTAAHDRTGELLADVGAISLLEPGKSTPAKTWRGRLVLTRDVLAVDGPAPFGLPLDRILAISLEVGHALQLRVDDRLFDVSPDTASTVKWGYFLKSWWSPPDQRGPPHGRM